MEMPRRGKRGKPNGGFPSFPTALGNRNDGDFHIPTGAAAGPLAFTRLKPSSRLRALAQDDIDTKILARTGMDRL
jgi:hypothetical protein